MKQKTLCALLYGALSFLSLSAVLALFLVAPQIGAEMAETEPSLAWAYWPWLLLIWALGAAFLTVVGFAFAIVRNISRGRAFSDENATHFACIAWISGIASPVFLAGVIVLGELGASAPFVFFGGLFCCFLGLAVSVGAATLSYLCANAADLQKKEDLTV